MLQSICLEQGWCIGRFGKYQTKEQAPNSRLPTEVMNKSIQHFAPLRHNVAPAALQIVLPFMLS